eukprot:CAMPEP_0118966002 /NCGR_PEP_ID=MMETSP1173-20130426/3508_1 /TAXON_ID=1034831 /ORGANISM="Rhizochromulina marina cf, Strain CCMP1243" /LENGTH=120 /DNA_ID=CAMNT_0006914707 /DNA_START=119 /DNA_END=479 /DNA_ORIENTATION=-
MEQVPIVLEMSSVTPTAVGASTHGTLHLDVVAPAPRFPGQKSAHNATCERVKPKWGMVCPQVRCTSAQLQPLSVVATRSPGQEKPLHGAGCSHSDALTHACMPAVQNSDKKNPHKVPDWW